MCLIECATSITGRSRSMAMYESDLICHISCWTFRKYLPYIDMATYESNLMCYIGFWTFWKCRPSMDMATYESNLIFVGIDMCL